MFWCPSTIDFVIMNCILLICETKEDAEHVIRKADTLPYTLNEIDVLSTHPEIKSIFEEHNICTVNSTSYVNRKDYEIINTDCMKIYSTLEINAKKIVPRNYSECFVKMFIYYTFFAFYTIVWNVRLLKNILSLGKYSEFITLAPKKNIGISPWYINEQNNLHFLFPSLIGDKKIKHVILKRSEFAKNDSRANFLLFLIRKLLNPVYSFLIKRISIRERDTPKVMIPSTAKNMNLLCLDLIQKYPNILFFSLGEGKSVFSELYNFYIMLKFLIAKNGINDQFLPEGKVVKLSLSLLNDFGEVEKQDFASDYYNKIMLGILEEDLKLDILSIQELTGVFQQNKIKHIFSYLQYQKFLSLGLEKFFKLCKPDMIFSQMSLGVTCTLGYIAEASGVSSMLISHGSHIHHHEGVAELEHKLIANNMLFGGYRFLGIQTSLSYDYVVRNQIPSRSIIKIKPTMLLNNQSNSKKKHQLWVLLASTSKDGTKRYIFETPDEMLETFLDTIEALSDCRNIKLIIKFRASESFSFKSLKVLLGNLPENVSLESDVPFGYFLASSHLLMSFSSTTIEEALINDTPVLLYGGKGRYSHIPTEPFKLSENDDILTPVTFVDNRESLLDYFKVLDKNFENFIDHQFDFSRYCLKDSMNILDWVEKNNILN